MPMHRKGTLSDAQTLGMYEDGVSIIALCIHEGMTCYGVISRLSRARREARRNAPTRSRRPVTRQATYASFDALRAAVRDLEQREKDYAR